MKEVRLPYCKVRPSAGWHFLRTFSRLSSTGNGATLALTRRMTMQASDLVRTVIGASIEVHRWVGPGLLESAYRACLQKELRVQGVPFECEVRLPVIYKGEPVECHYRIDFWFGNELVLELKSVENLLPVHSAQLLTYLKLTGAKQGLLINFNVPVLRSGIKSLML